MGIPTKKKSSSWRKADSEGGGAKGAEGRRGPRGTGNRVRFCRRNHFDNLRMMNQIRGYLFRYEVSSRFHVDKVGCVFRLCQSFPISSKVMLKFSIFAMAAFFLPAIHGSAIPMWEYLSRGEKMSHLFSLFVQQVEKHCAFRPEPDCSKTLLLYGLRNLAKMEDENLDDMDPYQRGASKIVWDSMMKGNTKHYLLDEETVKPHSDQNSTPNSLEVTNNTDETEASELGSEVAASNVNLEEARPQSFLLGPMVVRVLPNGMPIPGEKNHLPKDEDIEDITPYTFRRFHRLSPTDNKLINRREIESGSDFATVPHAYNGPLKIFTFPSPSYSAEH